MTVLVMAGILIFGLAAYRLLPVSTLPQVDFPTIQVTGELPGASPETMASAVATVLERQFSTIAGIDEMTSVSGQGVTRITIQFNLDRDIDAAAQDVNSAIASAARQLPATMPAPPSFRKVNPADFPVFFLALTSEALPISTVNEYAETNLAQRISTINGVAQVQVFGQQKYAVRVQIDPNALASRGVGINEVEAAVSSANVNLPTGTLYGKERIVAVQATGQLNDAAAFRPVIVTYRNGSPVRLQELGRVIDGVQNDKLGAWFKGKRGIVLAIQRQPGTNTIEVVNAVRALLPTFRAEVPPAISIDVLYDRSQTIRASVAEVEFTLYLALALVVMVIFLFLRNIPATIIPSVALPMSIIGTFSVMYLFGYSLDNISLMALTLCVGFVVDDAIVMLENITRHLEMGKSVMQATLDGSKEIVFTIISMTISLAAVFIPVLFMGGILGRLLHEFAVTIMAAVLISGFVSLTLTPMMCSRILKPHRADARHGRLYMAFENGFDAVRDAYEASLRFTLRHQRIALIVFLAICVLTVGLFVRQPKGFLPSEDAGQLLCFVEGPQDISFEAMVAVQRQVAEIIGQDPNVEHAMSFIGASGNQPLLNVGRITVTLKPFKQRKPADQVVRELRPKVANILGVKVFIQNIPSIRIGGQLTKSPYQYVMRSASLEELYHWSPIIEQKLRSLPGLIDVTSDLQITRPEVTVEIDREKASALGVSAQQIEMALNNAYGSRQVSTIYTATNQFWVILELDPRFQTDPTVLQMLYVRSNTGALVPLNAVAKAQVRGRAAAGHAPRPAHFRHLLVRPARRRRAVAGDRPGQRGDARAAGTGDAHRHVLRHGAGLPELAAGHGPADPAVDRGHLSRARRAVRELHPPAHHPRRAADRWPRRAHHVDGLQRHGLPGRAQHVCLRGHHHAGRDRQEERDHDDRFRHRGAAQGRDGAGARDRAGRRDPLPSDHDDHHGGADGQPADRDRLRRRRWRAHAARPRGGRRPAAFAGPHALHHAGRVPLLRASAGMAQQA
jgi:HAE1 family hydrophobic/amphiphilic exporter-1